MIAIWVTSAEVAAALAIPAADDLYLDACTEAANEWAFDRRKSSGYVDDPDLTPGPRVSLGVIQYAVALYRERGSADSFASFDAFDAGVMPSSNFGQILRLLGVPKPAVDRTPPVVVVP